MIVDFNKFNNLEPPSLTLCNPSCRYERGALTSAIGALTDVSDLEIVDNFNELSELNFTLAKSTGVPESTYNAVVNRRLVFVDDVGFFIINSVEERESDEGMYKSVGCVSCEAELENRMMPYIADSSYTLEDITNLIQEAAPTWGFNAFSNDTDITSRVRVFEDVEAETDILSYMIDELQHTFSVLFIFDTVNRMITVYDQSKFVLPSAVQLSARDVLESVEIKENSDDIYTVLNVEGGNDLTILPVNPLGENRIYDFSYYKSWMSDGLLTALNAWEAKLAAQEYSPDDDFTIDMKGEVYYDPTAGGYYMRWNSGAATHEAPLSEIKYLKLSQTYYDLQDTIYNVKWNSDNATTLRDLYSQCKVNVVSEATRPDGNIKAVADDYTSTLTAYNEQPLYTGVTVQLNELVATLNARIEEQEDKISAYERELADPHGLNDRAAALMAAMDTIVASLSFDNENNFSVAQRRELESYMFQATYTDEYTIKTDSMDQAEEFEQSYLLYTGAKDELSVICRPSQEFSVDAKFFVGLIDYRDAVSKIEVGRYLISVELHDGEVADLFLTSISVNYTDKSLSLTFGNRYNKYDNRTLYGDIFGGIQKTAVALRDIKTSLYPVTNGQLTSLTTAIRDARNVTKTSAIAADNQTVTIDESGYTGRRLNGSGGFNPEQIKIVNNSIVFTNNNWVNAVAAIGKMNIGGNDVYGVNAEAVVGELLVGDRLAVNVGEEDLSDIISDMKAGITAASEYKQYMSFDGDTGLIIGETSRGDVVDGEFAFYTVQTAEGYFFYSTRNKQVPFMSIAAVDGRIFVNAAEIKDRLSIGSDELGGCFDFIASENGLAVKWRDLASS